MIGNLFTIKTQAVILFEFLCVINFNWYPPKEMKFSV